MKSTLEKIRKPPSLQKRLSRTGLLFVMPFCILYAVFQLFPIFYSLVLSFYSWDGIGERQFVGLANYVKILTKDPYFFKSVGNVLILMLGYLPITLIIGFLIAVLLFNKCIRRKRFFQTVQFLPYIIVPVACGLLFMLLFDRGIGVINQILTSAGLIDENINWLGNPATGRLVLILMQIWRLSGYVMTIYLAGLTNISSELLEAAQIDGANARQVMIKIMLPLLKSVTIFLVLTSLIDGIQLFDAPKVLFTTGQSSAAIGGPQRSCLTPVWYMYTTSFGVNSLSDMGLGAAISYGIFLIIVVITLFFNKVLSRKE